MSTRFSTTVKLSFNRLSVQRAGDLCMHSGSNCSLGHLCSQSNCYSVGCFTCENVAVAAMRLDAQGRHKSRVLHSKKLL